MVEEKHNLRDEDPAIDCIIAARVMHNALDGFNDSVTVTQLRVKNASLIKLIGFPFTEQKVLEGKTEIDCWIPSPDGMHNY